MKVYIGPHHKWIGPYQIAYALCFWVKKVKDEECGDEDFPQWVHEFGTWLAEDKNGNDSLLAKFCLWVDKKRQRKVKIRIDNYDTWNMGDDLAMVILPMLKQLKATKHGSPYVDLEDVPEHLRANLNQKSFDFYDEGEQDEWDMVHKRWDYVLDEMIWAFEQVVDKENDKQFYTGEIDHLILPIDREGNALGPAVPFGSKDRVKAPMYKMVEGPNHTRKYDYAAHEKHDERIKNGLRLFGKYYHGLWD